MSECVLEKVTAFITRQRDQATDLLLFRHPTAGIQIPAGTVEPFEDPLNAVVREAWEETGLDDFSDVTYLGSGDDSLAPDEAVVVESTDVYVDTTSGISRGHLARGIQLRQLREAHGWKQINFKEWDRFPEPTLVMFELTGWVPNHCLSRRKRRTFYHLTSTDESTGSWLQDADGHTFECFWAPLDDLPDIISHHRRWLDFALKDCGYRF